MTVETTTSRRFLACEWADLSSWVMPSAVLFRCELPEGWIRECLMNLVTQITERVRVEAAVHYKMAGVRWYGGGVFLRESVQGDEISAAQISPLVPGALVYNRLFAWKASFAIVPDDHTDYFVSNEFPQFTVDDERILPEYLYLLCTRHETMRAVNMASTGSAAVSRNRLREDQFLAFDIPLPPLSWQKKVIARWQEAQQGIIAAKRRADEIAQEAEAEYLIDIGMKIPENSPLPKAFAVNWDNVDRWGVQIVGLGVRKKSSTSFPEVPLSELCDIGSGGTPSRRRPDYFGGGIPWVKTTEVRNEVIVSTEETLTEAGFNNSSAKLYPAGSLIIAMYGQGGTRGRSAKLGIEAATNQACAVLFNIHPEIDPDFLWYFLMSQYDSIRAEASGNNQPNLNAQMIADLRVPLSPLAEQKRIVAAASINRKKIAFERQMATKMLVDISAKIDSLIVGRAS
jgi:type I restriction enzyme S subunit